MSVAFVFGGQGADPVPAARELEPALTRALSEVVGVDLERALRAGSPVLAATAVRQPLLVAVALSVAARLPRPAWVAGHSLGALTARAFASGWTPLEAARIARARGLAMARVAAAVPGDLVAFRDGASANALRRQWPAEVAPAARNAPDEWVLAVRAPALGEALRRGGKRLRVGGPWHGPWMAPAATELEPVLDDPRLEPSEGAVAVVGGGLLEDLTRPVDWVATLARLGERASAIVVVGPGKAHRALVRRSLPAMPVRLIDRPSAATLGRAS